MKSKLVDEKALLNKAVQLLAQRNHSTIELTQKLLRFALSHYQKAQKQHQSSLETEFDSYDNFNFSFNAKQDIEQLVKTVVQHCVSQHWLDDADYVCQYIRVRARKGYSKARIVLELKQKGHELSAIMNTMEQSSIDWLAIGCSQLLKKFPQIDQHDLQQKVKIQQFFMSRGFPQSEIREIYELAIDRLSTNSFLHHTS